MMQEPKSIIFFFFLGIFFQSVHLDAQQQVKYFIHLYARHDSVVVENWKESDSIQVQHKVEKLLNTLKSGGYLLAQLDSLVRDSLTRNYHIYKGPKFTWISFRASNKLSAVKYESKNIEEWNHWQDEKIMADVSNGFPFSKIKLIHPVVSNDSLYADIVYEPGPFIQFGPSDQRKGKLLAPRYLERMSNVRMGYPYNQKYIEDAGDRLSQLPFLEMQYPPMVHFLGDKAMVWFFLKKKPANKFDFLLGLNSSNPGSSQKYRITGEATVELWNSFKIGERILLHYENLIEQSPRLNFLADFPYLRFLPVGFYGSFDLVKFRDEFVNLQSQLRIKYLLNASQEAGVLMHLNQSYVLQTDSNFIKNNLKLPASLDFSFNSYGFYYHLNQLDYRISPTRGWSLEVQIRGGSKQYLARNNVLKYDTPEGQLKMQYDSLNNSGLQLNTNFKSAYYWNMAKRQVIKIGIQGFMIFTEGKVLQNELFRIGGFKNLRGFDDDGYSSSAYWINTLEYRFLLDRNSFLQMFADHAYMRTISQNIATDWDHYFGIGAGIQFQTKAGAFILQLAVGRRPDDRFDFGAAKVHFGYSSLF